MPGTDFITDTQDEGTWFSFFESRITDNGKIEYDDPKPEAGRFCLRDITSFIKERLSSRKKKFEFVLNPETRAMERVGYYEDISPEQSKKEAEDLWDFAFTGLENFFIKGEEVPCTKEGKNRLMAIPVFDRCVAKCLKALNDVKTEAKEIEEKNSLSGSNGTMSTDPLVNDAEK